MRGESGLRRTVRLKQRTKPSFVKAKTILISCLRGDDLHSGALHPRRDYSGRLREVSRMGNPRRLSVLKAFLLSRRSCYPARGLTFPWWQAAVPESRTLCADSKLAPRKKPVLLLRFGEGASPLFPASPRLQPGARSLRSELITAGAQRDRYWIGRGVVTEHSLLASISSLATGIDDNSAIRLANDVSAAGNDRQLAGKFGVNLRVGIMPVTQTVSAFGYELRTSGHIRRVLVAKLMKNMTEWY
jgi:hypothetical protein